MMKKKAFDELTTMELYRLLALRTEIFVVEQNCPYQESMEKMNKPSIIGLKKMEKSSLPFAC